MKTYTYQEVMDNLNREYSRLVQEKLNAGVLIEYTFNSNLISFSDNTSLSLNNYGEYIGVVDLEYYKLSRKGHYVTKEDYEKVLAIREGRAKRKQRKDYLLVKSRPDSLIEKLRTIPGFKKVTKDNLVIVKNGYRNRWLLNCGTNKVMEYQVWSYYVEFRESSMSKEYFYERVVPAIK